MRKWEDIVKDKLEEADGTLPESVFAEFQARRSAPVKEPAPRRFALVWALIPAVAAGLAAVLLLHKPSVPESDIQIIRQPSAPLAAVTDSTMVNEPEQPTSSFIAQVVTPKAVRPSVVKPQEVETVENAIIEDKAIQEDVPQRDVPDSLDEKTPDSPITTATSPFIPENTQAAPVKMKVAPAVGIIAGGGLLAAVLPPLLRMGTKTENASMEIPTTDDGTNVLNPDTPKDERVGRPVHSFPLKVGLSARFPISDRLSITTGLAYSWYKSSFTYSVTGAKSQHAHYLGIPVRLDWTLASNRWLDVYLGGGLEGSYCLGATLEGQWIAKDGFSASLLGAGGLQLNITKNLGLYLEPQISWTFTPKNTVLETYQSAHPVMFSVSTGLRFTIGK